MEILRRATNPWGQQVLVGIGWDLVWLAVLASAAFVVGHALWMRLRGGAATAEAAPAPSGGTTPGVPERVQRHSLAARAFHWTMSVAVFGLLITAFVPVLGLQFPWVRLHWMAGVLLFAALVYHVIHAIGWQDLRSIWIAPRELGQGMRELRHALAPGDEPPPRSGKYPFDHRLYHHMAGIATLGAVATGLLMMVRIDTPFWTRNPYLLADTTWGVIYVVHGLSGVALIGLVAAHVYFAVRPEKRWITWSMIRGWIDREHYLAHHDPARWPAASAPPAPGQTGGGAALEGAPSARRDEP